MPRPNSVAVARDMPGPVVQYFRKRIKVGVDAVGPAAVEIGKVPAGAMLLPAYAKVITAFDGVGAIVTAGNGPAATNILAAGDVAEGTPGASAGILTGMALNFTAPTGIWVQWGLGSATVGEAVLVIPYVADDDQ